MEALRTWLTTSGTSQAALAKMVGVSQPCISDWVNGKVFPSLDNLRKLSRITEMTMDRLLAALPEPDVEAGTEPSDGADQASRSFG